VLSIPVNGGDFICRYQGSGVVDVAGAATNVTTAAGTVKFSVAPTYPNGSPVRLSWTVDPSNYIRNMDCREASASTTASIAPEFLSAASNFKVVRFMKWQPATEGNWPVTWATRNKPGDGDFTGKDGVPVELIVDAANQLNADPFVTIPWNADNDYITRFATYVRDNMAPGHQVYVETSNEVWNWVYPVATQSCNEAKAEGLLSAEGTGAPGCLGERYAERTRQVMAIWSNVFAGQMNRLVRVFAWQHVQPYWSDKLLAYQDTYKSVDALATAPYFGHEAPTWTAGQSLDTIMNTLLPTKVDEAVSFGVEQKAVAQKYGLRYVTYEAGQHVVLPDNQALLQQIELDPRMYGLYKRFIGGWQSKVGDTLTLFNLTGGFIGGGQWGMWQYAGQPVAATPKMQAVRDFLGITTASTDTSSVVVSPTTQVCPDGSVILSTSTCPTASPTTSGKKNGSTKGVGVGKGKGNAALA
jgi:hypothetical protein